MNSNPSSLIFLQLPADQEHGDVSPAQVTLRDVWSQPVSIPWELWFLGLDEWNLFYFRMENQKFLHEKLNFSAHGKNSCQRGKNRVKSFSGILLEMIKAERSLLPKAGACQPWECSGPSLCGKQHDKVGVSQQAAPQAIPNISKQPQVWEAEIQGFWLVFSADQTVAVTPRGHLGWFLSSKVLK